jgi:tRNA pseudouridine38-40 synthase
VLLTTDLALAPEIMQKVWNKTLPEDITIRSMQAAVDFFHPWYGVQQKIYYYHFFTHNPLPFTARYGWHYPYKIDFDKLQEALQMFVGTHDFTSFSCAEDKRNDKVRTIDAMYLRYLKKFGVYQIEVRGKKFLRHMIRRIVGASLYVASQKMVSCAMLAATSSAKNPNNQLLNAPAKGLLLRHIYYE